MFSATTWALEKNFIPEKNAFLSLKKDLNSARILFCNIQIMGIEANCTQLRLFYDEWTVFVKWNMME